MKATVICGLLGSGKTTFLTGALQAIRERVVVLVNDFGQAGIDGEIVSGAGVPTVELPSGCVCCTLRFDLVTTLNQIIADYKPDHIVVEPSGVASPSGVLEGLRSVGINKTSVVGILDASEFMAMYESGMYGAFLLDQVTQADVLLVNKTDLVSTSVLAETLSLVSSLNPGALVFPAVRGRIDHPFGLPASVKPPLSNSAASLPTFESFSAPLPGAALSEKVALLFEDLRQGLYGSVVRAKALVTDKERGIRIDLASGRIERSDLGFPVESSRLVVIGRNLEVEKLAGALRQETLM